MINETPPSPEEQGYKAGISFNPTDTANLQTTAAAQMEWAAGFKKGLIEVNERALAFLSVGVGVIKLHYGAQDGWSEVMSRTMRSSANAMACVFLGAELTHAGDLRHYLCDPEIEPRFLLEIASYAIRNEQLPERYASDQMLVTAYELASKIREYVVTTTGSAVSINADAMMRRIFYGDNPPAPAVEPEKPVITTDTMLPPGTKLPRVNRN